MRRSVRAGPRTTCASHNTGVKQLHHPVVGELDLSYNRFDLPGDHGLAIFTYAAEPGSRSDEALKLLGSWAATIDLAEPARSQALLAGQRTMLRSWTLERAPHLSLEAP